AAEPCPKCGHQRLESDTGPAGECPRCGVIYEKYRAHQARFAAVTQVVAVGDEAVAAASSEDDLSPGQRLWAMLWRTPERFDPLLFWGSALVLTGSVAWGLWFMFQPLTGMSINNSFLHRCDLPFHEFGHILFHPFGQWLMFLGGSLFQCLMPLILAVYFLRWQGQPFSAAICLWWCGQNFIDVAPYIADARAMVMPLTGEWSDEMVSIRDLRHDWHNILLPLHALAHDHALALLAKLIGSVLMLLSWVWGGMLLVMQHRQRG
ncbi:MAG: hypothetical protein JOY51_05185, partial [Nevskia sp.]|nr:hypothetical protein [Nevskia sp.]